MGNPENMVSAKQPNLCRLEYLTNEGWVVGAAGVGLLNPERYAERLGARGKFGRVTVLSVHDLSATNEVYETPGAQEAIGRLRPPVDGSTAHVLTEPCDLCGALDHQVYSECLL